MPITRFVVSLVVLSAFPVIATAQSDNPTATVPPTIADVQKVVQTINGDKIKLRAYCDIGKLQDQIRSAQDGTKEILGIWIEQTEGAKFWLRVMNELKNRGAQDILIAVVDGLKGFPEAINAVFPQTVIQTCIVGSLKKSSFLPAVFFSFAARTARS